MKWRNRGKPIAVILTVVLLAFLLFPFFVMLSSMFKSAEEVYTNPPTWIPKSWKFSNLIRLWTEFDFAVYFKSSVIISLGSTVLNTLLTVPAAYAVARLRFVGRRMMLYLFLVIQMFSPVIVVISLFKTMASLKLLNTYLSLILANSVFTIAFTIWMMNGYFRSIPKEIEEAALIDGCSRLTALIRVVVPIIAPGMAVVALFAFIATWNEFLFAVVLTGIETKTMMVLVTSFTSGGTDMFYGEASASVVLGVLPAFAVAFLLQRYLVKGLALGGTKG